MRSIDFEITADNLQADAKKLYTIIRPGVDVEDIKYAEFSEGVINSIVQLDDPKSKDPLVVRTYNLKLSPVKEDDFDISKFQNRELELAALKRASELGE